MSIDTVSWGAWKTRHPDSQVLSRATGFERPYGHDPYGSYYTDAGIMFPVEAEEETIHPKTVVFGIELAGVYKAYREQDVVKAGTIEDTVAGIRICIVRDSAGAVVVINLDNGERIVKERDFWFAWYAFHPSTLLYGR